MPLIVLKKQIRRHVGGSTWIRYARYCRLRIMCQFVEDIYKVATVTARSDMTIKERDYVTNVKRGYRSIILLLNIRKINY